MVAIFVLGITLLTERTKSLTTRLHVWAHNLHRQSVVSETLSPFLYWANVCSPSILRAVRRTMIRFFMELLVRRTWFGQFDELYFVLNWLVMRCKLRPELAADAQQTA